MFITYIETKSEGTLDICMNLGQTILKKLYKYISICRPYDKNERY